MTLQPLLQASPVIQVHAAAAIAALVLGALQFGLPRGFGRHRLMGRLWVGLMALVALSSFGISGLRQVGPFSWIHGLSVFTLGALVLAVAYARRRRLAAHRWAMIGLYLGALVVTGLFTLLPGRIMGHVVFG
ncbi:DUF2306 domain-containing protein [Methylobacterium nonmethylotrophicum]|uniref:DUF2306 domain-containing protein n=1 Tax=Methylobacterium nonmethylotrophicum TaxID=1141884 RepID=A0A4Z0NU17_9HYPH|nr:DUF2306 domain-containing protein [Methylobacterium nonmethylotrophicum]TGE00677.1 DUF2306 domain-containing protein [Methylobacterium nonmethylotrophicum]